MEAQTNNDTHVGNADELPQDTSAMVGQEGASADEPTNADADATLSEADSASWTDSGDTPEGIPLGEGNGEPRIGGGFSAVLDDEDTLSLGQGNGEPRIGGGSSAVLSDEDTLSLGQGNGEPRTNGDPSSTPETPQG